MLRTPSPNEGLPPPSGDFVGPTWLCGIDSSGGDQAPKSKSGIRMGVANGNFGNQ